MGNEIRLGRERNVKDETVNTAMLLQIPFAHSKFLVKWCDRWQHFCTPAVIPSFKTIMEEITEML